jgi:hypothetical protein
MENGVIVQSGTDAQTVSYYKGADLAMPNGTSSPTYTDATQTVMPTTGGVQIYFGNNGTVDMDYSPAKCGTPHVGFGATIYVKSNNKAAATDDAEKRRKVVVYGLSGRPRIIDSW